MLTLINLMRLKLSKFECVNLPGSSLFSPDRWRDSSLSAGVTVTTIVRIRSDGAPEDGAGASQRMNRYFCSKSQAINQYRIGRMAIRRQSERVRKHAVVSARRRPEVVVAPLSLSKGRPGPTKAELREEAAEAVASYAGPITRCAPKRRRAP